jgi:catechol 2,3-dioxygenase-like lactoylglutathione lyase family enzyme
MTPAPLSDNRITQIGFVVQNIEDAAQAWSRLLGIEPPEIIITDPPDLSHTEYKNQSTPARAKIVFIQLGQVTLELIEPVGGPSTWHDQLDSHGPSLHHIAFEVKGMAEQVAKLADHGLPLLQRGDYSGGRYAYLDGQPHLGAIVELLEND